MYGSSFEKKHAILMAVIGAAQNIALIAGEKVPNSGLLKKKPFPDRNMPKRVKRMLKIKAKEANSMKLLRMAMSAAMSAANVAKIQSTPFEKLCTPPTQ